MFCGIVHRTLIIFGEANLRYGKLLVEKLWGTPYRYRSCLLSVAPCRWRTAEQDCPPLFLQRVGRSAGTRCLAETPRGTNPRPSLLVAVKKRRSAMESSKPAQNIQDTFLNTARKERSSITIYLLSGVKLTGRIRSFDKYSVVLEANGQEQLIFKHAISTVVMGRVVSHGPHLSHAEPHPEPKATGATAPAVSAVSASGTEG
jgi:host factor-I protein